MVFYSQKVMHGSSSYIISPCSSPASMLKTFTEQTVKVLLYKRQ